MRDFKSNLERGILSHLPCGRRMSPKILKEYLFHLRNIFLWENFNQMGGKTTTKVIIKPVNRSTPNIG